MRLFRIYVISALFFAAGSSRVTADDSTSKEAIQKLLESQFAVTKTTADKTDIVTAGSVLVLQRDNLVMGAATGSTTFQSSYQDGKIKSGAAASATKLNTKIPKFLRNTLPGSDSAPAPSSRTFVAGEKMWLTKINVRDDAVVFDLFTDAYSDVRYTSTLTFKYPKGIQLTADQVEKLVAGVFKVQPSDEEKAGDKKQGSSAQPSAATHGVPTPEKPAAAPPAVVEPPLAPIAPPPPPVDQPPATIGVGETMDQVTAALGPPPRTATVGKKVIYFYKDMKVTFVDRKVTDVQ